MDQTGESAHAIDVLASQSRHGVGAIQARAAADPAPYLGAAFRMSNDRR
jgi:hypothetical protein